ncbi:MAG: hypothetical protein WAU47_01865 [Desulfobaccales bacterium]
MAYAILRDEGSIHAKIRELFSGRRSRSHRRVILGPLAALAPLAHLQDIRDVEFYSWGQENLPDPGPLNTLADRGVRINWVNPMQLQLYWVKGKGAVIGPGLRANHLLADYNPETQGDLALYLDNRTLAAVDEVLGPLLLEPADNDTFSDLQESCNLLWRLAEGITWAEPPRAYSKKVPVKIRARIEPEDSLTALAERQKAWARESWHSFLAEETKGSEGLLCFFDQPRSRLVERCCRAFVSMGAFSLA